MTATRLETWLWKKVKILSNKATAPTHFFPTLWICIKHECLLKNMLSKISMKMRRVKSLSLYMHVLLYVAIILLSRSNHRIWYNLKSLKHFWKGFDNKTSRSKSLFAGMLLHTSANKYAGNILPWICLS